MPDKKKKTNLRKQIMRGYVKIIMFSCIIASLTIISLSTLFHQYEYISDLDEERATISSTISAHYQWRSDLSSSLQTGKPFNGSLDPTACSFGQWVTKKSSSKDVPSVVTSLIQQIEEPHRKIHTTAKNLVEMRNTNIAEVMNQFYTEVDPMTDQVIQNLQKIDDYYANEIISSKKSFENVVFFIVVAIIISMIIIVGFSIFYANRLSTQISLPVMKTADWANRLSLGAVDLEFDEDFEKMYEANKGNEVGSMIEAFRTMAKNIKENVEVLKRVAEGDMTAFVNIRSHHDSLGKSLYRLVQSNDAMFNEIVQAAHTVAAGAGEIANASHALAESATLQVTAANNLSNEINHVNALIHSNDEKAKHAHQITKEIEADILTNNEHMGVLVKSVIHMHDASQKISTVMKAIDDIAFETNILALNAAIEAARAGMAGKGFAVVADEVRALALKSTEAAKESRALIENSILQTQKGSEIASASASIFDTINDKIGQVVKIVEEVSSLSGQQLDGIKMVSKSIEEITQAATSNAAISEQSDASGQEMSQQADFLRNAMKHFNLRAREEGQAFIPPEKQNDSEFIRRANEAYQMTENTGKYGYEYIDPFGEEMESIIFEQD